MRSFWAIAAALQVSAGAREQDMEVTPQQGNHFINVHEDPESEMTLKDFVARGGSILQAFMNSTRQLVRSWPLRPAQLQTDRVAVIIFQPAAELRLFEYVIRSTLRRLGPQWALQIFFGRDVDRRRLGRALGWPLYVIWTPIRLRGQRRGDLGYREAQWFRLGVDFWGAIRPEHEHVLLFEADTLMLRGPGCVEEYFGFDYVGAPWHDFFTSHLGYPKHGGNGGLSLRKRSKIMQAVTSRACDRSRGPSPEECSSFEDEVLVRLLSRMNASFPSRDAAAGFSVESVFHPRPCGFHKPWYYQEPQVLLHLLSTAQVS